LIDVICIYLFCFGNQTIILDVLDDIRTKTQKKVEIVVKTSFYIELTCYTLIIFIGYFSTFDKTTDIFINREGESKIMVWAKLFYCLIIICDIAMLYYWCRSGIEWTVGLVDRKFTFWENFFSATIVLSTLTVLSYFTDVITIMSFLGATAQIYFVFFIPSNSIN